MALLQCSFFSETLRLSTSMNVILPQAASGQIGMEGSTTAAPPPVLYLLHGLSDDHSIWLRRTSIERYVAGYPLAVVMPNVHRSFYTDMAHGNAYWTFISEELPKIVGSLFNVSQEKEKTFVAGLSMGGYGAFKLALSHPERFAAAASLSGCLDICNASRNGEASELCNYEQIFGPLDELPESQNDLLSLLKKFPADEAIRFYQCCGTDDFLYEDNQTFRHLAQKKQLDLVYEEHPNETHNWGYWDRQIQRVLDWLPLEEA